MKVTVKERHLNEAPMVDLSDDELAVVNNMRANRTKKVGNLKDRLAKRNTRLKDEETAKKQAELDTIKVAVKNLKPLYADGMNALEGYTEIAEQGLVQDFKKVTNIDSDIIYGFEYMSENKIGNRAYPAARVMLKSNYNTNARIVFKANKVYLQGGVDRKYGNSNMYELTDANIDKLLDTVYSRQEYSYGPYAYAVVLDTAFGETSNEHYYYSTFIYYIVGAIKELIRDINKFNDALDKYSEYLDKENEG